MAGLQNIFGEKFNSKNLQNFESLNMRNLTVLFEF